MKRPIIILGTIIMLTTLAVSCKNSIPPKFNGIDSNFVTKNELETTLKAQNGLTLITKNSKFELYVDPESTEIAVKDLKSNYMWYSNPVNRANDSFPSANIPLLNSQLNIEYFDDSNKNHSLDSYIDCVNLKQYEFAAIRNGIRITYTIGKQNKIYIVPKIMKKEKFEEFVAKLSEEDKIYLTDRYELKSIKGLNESLAKDVTDVYPIVKKHDIYALPSTVSDFLLAKMEKTFTTNGYSLKDLEKDNLENELPAPEKAVKFIIPLEYTIDETGLIVNIPIKQLQYSKDVIFTNLKVLQYFGAADTTKKGYMVVPDGSGAIINLNNGKTQYEPYSKKIYGEDYTIIKKENTSLQIPCYLPVFGMKQENNAFLSIIESGDASAAINAKVSNYDSSYNSVFSDFTITKSSLEPLPYNDKLVYMFSKKPLDADIRLKYIFLSGEESDYSGMAKSYQKYLIDKGMLKTVKANENIALTVNAIGTVDYQASKFGIPIKGYKPLTTYKNAITLLQKLKSDGVPDVTFKYTSWQNGGFNNKINREVKLISELGSRSEFDNLVKYCKENGIDFYPDVDFLYVAKNDIFDSFNQFIDSSKYLTSEIAYKFSYKLSTNTRDFWTKRFILKPTTYANNVNNFLSDYKRFGIGNVSLENFGTELNSDFTKNNVINREHTKDIIISILSKLTDDKTNIISKGANYYTLKFLNQVTDMPMDSSEYYLFDKSIPFLQIVVHGFVPYSTPPLNYEIDYDYAVLKAIETGSAPQFEWMYADNATIKDTNSNFINLSYKTWYDKAIKDYEKINSVLSKVLNSSIISHNEIASNVFSTHYNNGLVVYTNFNDQEYIAEGIEVNKMSYLAVKE